MEELSVRAKQVFELMKQYSVKNNIKTMGSEYIILAMYETEDSLCHFLLSEYEITKEEIMDKTKDVYILRKENGEYNSSLNTIIKQAKMLSNDNPIEKFYNLFNIRGFRFIYRQFNRRCKRNI